MADAGAADPPVSFADIAERLNPAVVNIDATSRGGAPPAPPVSDHSCRTAPIRSTRRPTASATARGGAPAPGSSSTPTATSSRTTTSSSGADRIMVRLTDGRTLRAERIGSDPDTDIALIKVDSPQPLPFAPLGDSDTLRVGEWVRGHRQPAGLRAHRDRGRRQLHRPQAVRLVARPLHPDRRRDQLRQQRRAADQRARRSHRHQRRDQLAGLEHRLRRADQPGDAPSCRSCARRAASRAATSAWR